MFSKATGNPEVAPCKFEDDKPECLFQILPAPPPAGRSTDGYKSYFIKLWNEDLCLKAGRGLYAHPDANALVLEECKMGDQDVQGMWTIRPLPSQDGFYDIRLLGWTGYQSLRSAASIGSTTAPAIDESCFNYGSPPGGDSQCMWKVQSRCIDIDATCKTQVGVYGCTANLKKRCRLTCNVCFHATGKWVNVQSNSYGPVNYVYTVGTVETISNSASSSVSTETTLSGSLTLSAAIHASMSAEVNFLVEKNTIEAGIEFGTSVTLGLSETSTNTVSTDVTKTLSRSSSEQFSTTCPMQLQLGPKVAMYQWIVTMLDGNYSVHSRHFRCHYYDGLPSAPQCPYPFCGSNNRLCKEAGCHQGWHLGA